MTIGKNNQMNMLIAYENTNSVRDPVLKVHFNMNEPESGIIDHSRLLNELNHHLVSANNLVSGSPFIVNIPSDTFGMPYSESIFINNKTAIRFDYSGLSLVVPSYNQGGLSDAKGRLSVSFVCVFNVVGSRSGVRWKKLLGIGNDGSFVALNRFGNNATINFQFMGQGLPSTEESVPFDWADTTTALHYVATNSVHQTGAKTFDFHIELWSFGNTYDSRVKIGEANFTKEVDMATISQSLFDRELLHIAVDNAYTNSWDDFSSVSIGEARMYVGEMTSEYRTELISDLIKYWTT